MQFPITAHTNIRAGQTIRFDCMELAASIRATNSDDCFAGVVYLIWDHHWIARGLAHACEGMPQVWMQQCNPV